MSNKRKMGDIGGYGVQRGVLGESGKDDVGGGEREMSRDEERDEMCK